MGTSTGALSCEWPSLLWIEIVTSPFLHRQICDTYLLEVPTGAGPHPAPPCLCCLSLPARGWLDTQAHGASLCGTWHPWPRLSVNLFLQDSRTTGIAGHRPSPECVADVAPPSPGSRPQGGPMSVVMSPVSRGWSLSPMPEELPLCPQSPLTSSPCSRSRFLHVATWCGLGSFGLLHNFV